MFSFLNETVTAWLERARTPILGYFALSFVVANWKPLWVLFITDIPHLEKFSYFDEHTSLASLVVWPLLAGAGLMLLLPWARLIGLHVVRAPIKKYTNLQHDHGQELRIYRLRRAAEEVQAQAERDASYEQAKIDAAERMARAREVGGENLKNELEADRAERKEESNEVTSYSQTRDVQPDATQAGKAVQLILNRRSTDPGNNKTDEQLVSFTASDIIKILEALSGLTTLEKSKVFAENLRGVRAKIQGRVVDVISRGDYITLMLNIPSEGFIHVFAEYNKECIDNIEAVKKGASVEVIGALQGIHDNHISVAGEAFLMMHPE